MVLEAQGLPPTHCGCRLGHVNEALGACFLICPTEQPAGPLTARPSERAPASPSLPGKASVGTS